MNDRQITADDLRDGDRAIASDAGGRDALVERHGGRVYFVSWRDECAADLDVDRLPIIHLEETPCPDRVTGYPAF
jgi:hypothetical protein